MAIISTVTGSQSLPLFYLVEQDFGFEISKDGVILGLTNLSCLSYNTADKPIESPSLDDLRDRIARGNPTHQQSFESGKMLKFHANPERGELIYQPNEGTMHF